MISKWSSNVTGVGFKYSGNILLLDYKNKLCVVQNTVGHLHILTMKNRQIASNQKLVSQNINRYTILQRMTLIHHYHLV